MTELGSSSVGDCGREHKGNVSAHLDYFFSPSGEVSEQTFQQKKQSLKYV